MESRGDLAVRSSAARHGACAVGRPVDRTETCGLQPLCIKCGPKTVRRCLNHLPLVFKITSEALPQVKNL